MRKWQPTPVFLPGESAEQRSLMGYSWGGRKESDTTEQLNNKSTTKKLILKTLDDNIDLLCTKDKQKGT